MPLNDAILAPQIKVAIPAQISTMFSTAVPMPFQEILAQAVAKGIVKTLKDLGKVSGGPGIVGPTGPGVGITGLSASLMTSIGMAYYSEKVGSVGVALKPLLDGVFIPTVAHMAMAQIISTNGFGGQATKVLGWSADVMAQNIIDSFPEPNLSQIKQSKTGQILMFAIATGFTKNTQAAGIPGFIPATGPVPGPVEGKIS